VSVYVDEVRRWPTRIRCFRNGSAHLTADTLEELHAMAERIGLRRAWFQGRRVPHYDLTPTRREAALAEGAVFVPAKEQAKRRIAAAREAASEDAEILYREGIAVQRSMVDTPVGDAVRAAIEARGREAVDEMLERAMEQSLSKLNDGRPLRGREHLVRRAFIDAYRRVADETEGR